MMLSDAGVPPSASASASAAELAEKLEKSEAGRKKLRQAISLMQEKLQETENVLKINESLRLECEKERERAEEEKKKVEEERRLRCLSEKDSATVKEQLAKVLQRLGALEAKQKSDRKEVEFFRNEVRSAVDGVSAAAEAIKSIQCSFHALEQSVTQKVNVASEEAKKAQESVRSLENEITKKTNRAFEEAGNVMQIVKSLQQSFHSLENRAVVRVDEKLTNAETKHISEKLVAGITQLFNKEKKTHRKIEHQLAVLKTMLRSSQSDSIIPEKLSSPEERKCKESRRKKKHKDSTNKGNNTESPKHEKAQASEKRKLMREVEPSDWCANKKQKLQDGDARNSKFKVGIQGNNESNKGPVKSPQRIEYNKRAGLSSYKVSEHGLSSNFSIGLALPEQISNLNQNQSLQSLNGQHKKICKERKAEVSANVQKGLRRNIDLSVQTRRHESSVYGNQSANTTETNCIYESNYSCLECSDDDNDLDDDWWPGDTTPLSPTLPEIHFPGQLIQSSYVNKSTSKDHNFATPVVDLHTKSVLKPHFLQTNELVNNSPVNTFSRPEFSLLEIDHCAEIKANPMDECRIIADNAAVCMNNIYLDNGNIAGSSDVNRSGANFDCAGAASTCNDSKMHNAKAGTSTDKPDFGTATQLSEAILESTIPNGQNPQSDSVIDPENIRGHVYDGNVVTESVMISTDSMMKGIEFQRSPNVLPSDWGSARDHCGNYMVSTNKSSLFDSTARLELGSYTLDDESKAQPSVIGSVESLQKRSIPSPNTNRMLEQDVAHIIDSSYETAFVPEASMDQIRTAPHSLGEERKESINDLEFETIDLNKIDQMNSLVEVSPSILPNDTCLISALSNEKKISYLFEKATESTSLIGTDTKDIKVSEKITCSWVQLQEMSRNMEISSFTQKVSIPQTESTHLQHENMSVLETATSTCVESNDSCRQIFCKICLLQAFDFEKLEVKTRVTEAYLNTVKFSEYFSRAYTDKGIELPEKALHLRRDCAEIPIQIIACCFISIVVTIVKRFKGEDEYTEKERVGALVMVFITFIRTVFTDMASLLFEEFFAQLGMFLCKTKVILLTLKKLECSSIDVSGTVNYTNSISFEYSEATLEDVHAGSKVLAGLCQVLSCVSHLQNVVYELLGCCDKDTIWLLTVFSSFASICGHTAFIVDTDDILGQAISAIVIELVVDFQQESSKHEETPVTASSNLLKGFTYLINILDPGLKLNVADVFIEAMAILEHVLGSCKSLAANSTPTHNLSCSENCNADNGFQSTQCTETGEVSKLCRDKDDDTRIHTCQREIDFQSMKSWQKKYTESIGALELIAVFMGWEWTYNHLIIRCLWRKIASSSGQIETACIMHAITVLARNGLSTSGEESPGIRELRTWMMNSSAVLAAAPYFFSL